MSHDKPAELPTQRKRAARVADRAGEHEPEPDNGWLCRPSPLRVRLDQLARLVAKGRA